MGEYKEVLLVVIGFLAKEVWDWIKGKLNRQSEKEELELQAERAERKELTKATHALNQSVMKLDLRMGNLEKALEVIPKLERDVNEAHSKIREDRAARNGRGNGGAKS